MERISFSNFIIPAALAFTLLALSGCLQDQIDANRATLEQQQTQIEQMQQQMAAMQSQSYSAPHSTLPPGAGCDTSVMGVATRRGGEKFASGDFSRALGYYEDALTACPGNPKAELNVARTQEALGNRAGAIGYYQRAAASTDTSELETENQARSALARLGASK